MSDKLEGSLGQMKSMDGYLNIHLYVQFAVVNLLQIETKLM